MRGWNDRSSSRRGGHLREPIGGERHLDLVERRVRRQSLPPARRREAAALVEGSCTRVRLCYPQVQVGYVVVPAPADDGRYKRSTDASASMLGLDPHADEPCHVVALCFAEHTGDSTRAPAVSSATNAAAALCGAAHDLQSSSGRERSSAIEVAKAFGASVRAWSRRRFNSLQSCVSEHLTITSEGYVSMSGASSAGLRRLRTEAARFSDGSRSAAPGWLSQRAAPATAHRPRTVCRRSDASAAAALMRAMWLNACG